MAKTQQDIFEEITNFKRHGDDLKENRRTGTIHLSSGAKISIEGMLPCDDPAFVFVSRDGGSLEAIRKDAIVRIEANFRWQFENSK